MKRRFVSTAPPPTFTVELHSGHRRFHKFDVESLISSCPSVPNHYVAFSCGGGPLAARLLFRQWPDALDAVTFFWARLLDGSHHLIPTVRSALSPLSDHKDLTTRLSSLFSARVRDLLEGDSVHRWRKKIVRLMEEISRSSATLRKANRLNVFSDLEQKKRSLESEREQIEKRLEEFKAAMYCILEHLDGPSWEDRGEDGVEVFRFGDFVDWRRIQHLMLRECRRLDDGLPIYNHRREILRQIHCQQVMVLTGETGSGKSTQLVQFLADSGLAANGSIVCTQPRKIAAMSLAERIRKESDGCYADDSVTFCGAYSSVQRLDSKVIFMTDHCLLQHFMNGISLDGISCIIVDEAHERSLNTDLLLALIKKLLLQRPDLRLIIMSATANVKQLSEYFSGCGTFHVMGRSFPVDIKYIPNADEVCSCAVIEKHNLDSCASYVSDTVKMVAKIHRTEEDGAILAFLTSQSEVEWVCEKFQAPSAIALPLHGKLSCEEQSRVFHNYQGKRKVIFATNLAETSLTIPGIKYVVDSGMVKESRFEPSTGMNVLRVCRISQSSAHQRAGRAGRTEPGICYRLYSESDFESMPCHVEPEIRRVHLGIAVLRILSLGIKDVEDFDFVDTPSPEAIQMAVRNLVQLGAVIYKNDILELTDSGHPLVKLGVEPRLGKLILESFHHGLGREGLVLAAVMANESSIFCRVGNNVEKSRADCLKVQFCHPDGDLFTLLTVYKEWDDEPQDRKNKWCWKNSINAKTMRRCHDTVLELENCLQHELRLSVPTNWRWEPHVPGTHGRLLKKIILSSLSDNVAAYSGDGQLGYEVAFTGQCIQLHPSCSLLAYCQNPSWVVFGQLLSVSKQYLVCVTAIDRECLFTLQPPPSFDVVKLESRRVHVNVITGVSSNLLRRFCGKSNNSLHHLLSRIRRDCMDNCDAVQKEGTDSHIGFQSDGMECRIRVDVDFEKQEIHIFASSKDMPKVSSIVSNSLEYEAKWLRDECIEKFLFHGVPNISPPIALLGAGACIRHLELEKRYLTVEVFHSNANNLDDKKLLLLFDKCASGVASFHKYLGTEDLERWGKVTFLSPESATAAVELNDVEFEGSLLKVLPLTCSSGCDKKMLPFPAVSAKVSWPRRPSTGVALITCARIEDACFICKICSNMWIGGRRVQFKISKKQEGCLLVSGLGSEISEVDISDALRNVRIRRIKDIFLLRGEAVDKLSVNACANALVREIAPFMPSKNSPDNYFRVQVFQTKSKDYSMKALITLDGSLHLEAAKALQHLEGKVLPGLLPWQKIQCLQLFHGSVSCPAPVYHVIKKELGNLFASFSGRKGISYNLEKNDNGSYRVKISSNATKTMAELRNPLDKLMKGKTIDHASLTPNVLQLLFSREALGMMKRLEQETGTYILHDKQHWNIRVFGPPEAVNAAEQKVVQSLLELHENKQLKIHLRGRNLPPNLMKEVVQRFGADLYGLKEKVPGAELVLDTRRHVISIQGSQDLKKKVEEILFELARSLSSELYEPFPIEDICSICLCEVDNCYQLEACGHRFCYTCLVEQCESAIRSRDGFPLCCTREGCRSKILLVDLRTLLPSDKMEELFRASLAAFVASSGGVYRFCPSPDCPSVYRAADPDTLLEQPPFVCGACFVETCTKCHLEYHPMVPCAKYRELKDDPDASLVEWRKGKDNVKNCPHCGYTIDKVDGCNHVTCKCEKHICWVCLEYFNSSVLCYEHISVHHAMLLQFDE